ncbi:YceK/YidQ family lipoprotein, partial [Pseudomonas cichorii]
RFGAEAPEYPALDLPASALLDTLLLPLSLLTALGVGYQAQGGL